MKQIQPTQVQLEEAPAYLKFFNPYEWGMVQGLLKTVMNERVWEDYEMVLPYLEALQLPDDPIISEWAEGFDFLATNEGFSIVPDGGGTWTVNSGWVSGIVSDGRQVHIEKDFPLVTGVTGVFLLFNVGTNNATSHELEITIRQNGVETTYYSAAMSTGNGQSILLETTNYEGIDRIRVRGKSVNATSGFISFRRMIVWGNGQDPFS